MTAELNRIIAGREWTGRLMKPSASVPLVAWGFGFDPADKPVSTIGVVLGRECAGHEVRLRMWHHPNRTIGAPFAFDRKQRPLFDRKYLIPGTRAENIPQYHWLDLDGLKRTGPGLHVCEFSLPDGRALRPLAAGLAHFQAPWDWEAGWLMLDGQEPRPAKLPHGFAWLLRGPATSERPNWTLGSGAVGPGEPIETSGDFELRLPMQRLERVGWTATLAPRSLEIPPPARSETIVEMPPGQQQLQLRFRHAEILEAPASVSYRANDAMLIRSGDAKDPIGIRVRGWNSRYDLISVNPASGHVQLTLGAERALDPEEFAAQSPAGHVPLYSVYTTFEGVEAIPLAGWNGLVKAGEEARYVSWLEFCRQRLPATLRKLRSGQDIRLAGYGDSITSLGGRDPEMLVIPNGMHRDNLGYFERYSADWKIAQAHPTDYGAQKVPHHRLGWNWQLKRTVEERWPVQVEYLNWGVPGTTSDAGERVIEDCAYLNGANPARLARLLEDRPDIVTVGFGMNDVGEQIDTRANIVAICNAIRGGGAEVIVIGPCRQNPSWNSRDPMLWKHTYEAVIAGAFEAGVAFVPTWELFGDGNEGATGLSRRSHCAASMGNHPGARELAAVGKLLSAIIP